MKNAGLNLTRLLLAIFCAGMADAVFAQIPAKKQSATPRSQQKVTGMPNYTLLNINNIASWMGANGLSGYSPWTDGNGVYFPRGTSWLVFQDGIKWGGKAYTNAGRTQPAPFGQLLRVGGADYKIGTRAGRIIGFGATAAPADTAAPESRVYRIRRDYAFADLRQDAAELKAIAITRVTEADIQEVRAQYAKDWLEWPAPFGAPFIDRNNNGRYDPPPPNLTPEQLIADNHDEPGFAGVDKNLPADQVVWTVFNDLDRNQTRQLLGSEPLGLEVQVTLWGYKGAGAGSNAFFRRARIINKGGVAIDTSNTKGAFYIDSLYVGQWADMDIGDFGDDLVGCDTTLGLGYSYNGTPIDREFRQFNLPPPAGGYDLLQGPMIPSPGSTAVFDFKRRAGFKNLRMTAFSYYSPGSAITQPPNDYANGAFYWYKLLRGFLPIAGPDQYFPFPPGVAPNHFPLSGDPVNKTGFLDGQGTNYSLPPSDRRFSLSSGPLRLAPGDTQEVVLAFVAGLGADRLSSVSAMRLSDRLAQEKYNALVLGVISGPAPMVAAQVSYPNANQATLKITASRAPAGTATMTAALYGQYDQRPIVDIELFDDGRHVDGAANDGLFANQVTINRQRSPFGADLMAQDRIGRMGKWERVLRDVVTAGLVEIDSLQIFSDHLNSDGKANPGENVRFGFRVSNFTPFELSMFFRTGGYPLPLNIGPISAGKTFSFHYDPTKPESYRFVDLPVDFADSLYQIPFDFSDYDLNSWQDTLRFRVYPLPHPYTEAQLKHITGAADGNFGFRLLDRQALKNHEYRIGGVDSIDAPGNRGFTLKDMTDGRTLLLNHPLPDELGHNIPVTDGFKILRGTIPDQNKVGMAGWSVSHGKQVWNWINARDLNFEGFDGAIGWAEPRQYFGGSQKTLKATELKNTLIKFATTDTAGNVLDANDPNWSYAYRYGRRFSEPPAQPGFAPFILNPAGGFAYQAYQKSVPFSAWDLETNPPRRLMVGHLENNVADGLVDGKYWPPTFSTANNSAASGPREWFFILNVGYRETPDTRLTLDLLSNPAPVMWWGTPARNGNIAFQRDDEFLILARHLVTSQDVWAFNPALVGVVERENLPNTFALAQNYPNPFWSTATSRKGNPGTTISFSLPQISQVSLRIFNMLGQEVLTLVNQKLPPGVHTQLWRGADRFGRLLPSGVYFYRLEIASPATTSASKLALTKKMLLLRQR